MHFYFESINKQGKAVVGEYDADSKGDVVEYLQKRHLIPLRINEKLVQKEGWNTSLFERITNLDRITLTRNLAATSRAGLSIVESFDILAQDTGKNLLKNVLLHIKNSVINGQPMWQAFHYYKEHFPPFFVGMVRAAESSGKLDVTLEELTRYLTREYNLVKKIKSAMAYPVILIIASLGVLTLLLGFVLPSVEKTFERSRITLPVFTQILLKISHAIRYSLILDVIVVIFFGVGLFLLFRNNKAKEWFAKFLFKIPLIRDVLKKIVLVRFSRTLGSLLASGVLITESLELAGDSVGNEYYKEVILKVKADVTKGIPLSKSLGSYEKLFPHFLCSLILVGEKTGTLEHILKTFADFYDEEVDYSLKTLTSFMEPAMLLIMGLIIGFIVLSILLPIYQFVGNYL